MDRLAVVLSRLRHTAEAPIPDSLSLRVCRPMVSAFKRTSSDELIDRIQGAGSYRSSRSPGPASGGRY